MITLFVKITTASDQELWVGMNGSREIRLFITNATDPDNCKPLSRDNRPDVEKQFGEKAFEEAFAIRGFIECMLYSDEPLDRSQYDSDFSRNGGDHSLDRSGNGQRGGSK